MKQVNVKDDPMGSELKAVFDKYNADSYMVVSIDDNKAGATMFATENMGKAMTMMSLLFNALPDLFSVFIQAVLQTYLEQLRGVLSTKGEFSGQIEKTMAEPVDMNDYVKGVKF